MTNEKLYSLQQISHAYNVPVSTLRKRCVKNKFIRNINDTYYKYLLNELQTELITKKELNQFNFGEIIYVHTTWLILESKMNWK